MSGSEEESAATPQDNVVTNMRESGMDWNEIADELGTDVDGAMQVYRNEAYDHWDTGWTRDADDGTGHFETGSIDVWHNGDGTVKLEEVSDSIPLAIIVDNGETRTLTDAHLTANQARDLAAALDECADILEGEK